MEKNCGAAIHPHGGIRLFWSLNTCDDTWAVNSVADFSWNDSMSQPDKTQSAARGYWEKRQDLVYYRYVDLIVRGVAANVKSMIDVGSSNTSVLEWFDWVAIRHALDKRNPYSSESVGAIEEDFLAFNPAQKYDLAICLQVLEHIPDAGAFARKLFEISHSVLISVPYQWPKGDCKYHRHDPVDVSKLQSWTQRKPDYQIVAIEPLIDSPKGQRLIAYYHNPGEKFSLAQARSRLNKT